MSLNTFNIGLSGLNANSQGLSVVGNNLANLNTVGFKGSDISFSDVMGETSGLGTHVGGAHTNFGAGSIQSTGNPLDYAVQGKGFFVVNNANGTFYSRAGAMHFDKNNFIVNQEGLNLQGFVRNPTTGKIDTGLGLQSIQLPLGLESPVKTTSFQVAMNLDGGAPSDTRFTTSVQIYDSRGTAHAATISLIKDVTGGAAPLTQWHFDVTIPNKDVAGVANTDTKQYSLITGDIAADPPAAGTLVFDADGHMSSAYIGSAPATLPALDNLTIPPTGTTLPAMSGGGLLNDTLTWRLIGNDGNPAVSSNTGVVQGFASPSDVTFSTQDGSAAGFLSSTNIQPDGTISAVFTNGKTIDFAKIALSLFTNEDGLKPVGSGLFTETAASGVGYIGSASEGGRGNLIGGSLEASNVDLATELTKIITFQRGYQANAKVITTTDQIIQETMNMKQ